MKKLKRLTTLFLMGILALVILTGCSTNNFGQQVETDIVKAFNNARTTNSVPLTNDATLRAQCVEALSHIQNGLIQVQYARQSKDGTVLEVYTVETISFKYPSSQGTLYAHAQSFTSELVAKMVAEVQQDTNNADMYNRLTAVGVATKTIGENTYLAVAMKFN